MTGQQQALVNYFRSLVSVARNQLRRQRQAPALRFSSDRSLPISVLAIPDGTCRVSAQIAGVEMSQEIGYEGESASLLSTEDGGTRTCMLVASCDSYSDLWPALSMSMRRYWPDCPFPRFLLTNHKEAPAGFSTLAVGPDVSWSANLVHALEQLETDYVLLSVDDLLLTKTVRTDSVLEAVRWATVNRVTALQLVSHEHLWGGAWSRSSLPPIRLPSGATYRASTVFTLWNRDGLLRLLNPAENAWQFEYLGSERLSPNSPVFLTTRSHFAYLNGVIKGKLTRSAVKFCKNNGHPLPASRRVMTAREEWWLLFLRFRACALRTIPLGYRKTSKEAIRRTSLSIQKLYFHLDLRPSKKGD